MARKRSHMSKSKSRSDFRRKSGTHPKNSGNGPVLPRGGIRL